MDEVITKAELARRLGISKARVSQLVGRGLPVNKDGRVNADEAVKWVTSHSRAALNGKGALAGAQRAAAIQEAGLPEHFGFVLDLAEEVDRGAVLAALQVVYRAPALAALMAKEHGASVETAKAMFNPLAHALMVEAAAILKKLGCEPFASSEDPPVWDTDGFLRVNWSKYGEDTPL